tara:strand:+ start:145 stop:867 length:723 start_codon:yes stop_codon:yes gene_type:complete
MNKFNKNYSEFNFVDNKYWLLPFLISIDREYDKNKIISYKDTESFAITNVDRVFRPRGIFTKSYNQYYSDWSECSRVYNIKLYDNCRKSPGFENKYVPDSRKFNPKYKKIINFRLKYELQLAKDSYNYLECIKAIDTMLKTPSSDYVRFSIDYNTSDIENKIFMINLRNIQNNKSSKDNYRAIIQAYGYDTSLSMYKIKNIQKDNNILINDTITIINNKLNNINNDVTNELTNDVNNDVI